MHTSALPSLRSLPSGSLHHKKRRRRSVVQIANCASELRRQSGGSTRAVSELARHSGSGIIAKKAHPRLERMSMPNYTYIYMTNRNRTLETSTLSHGRVEARCPTTMRPYRCGTGFKISCSKTPTQSLSIRVVAVHCNVHFRRTSHSGCSTPGSGKNE